MVIEGAQPVDAAPIAAVLRDVTWSGEDRRRAGLTDLRLILHEGEHVALAGPPGSGRGALLRLLDGSLANWTGSVFLHGQPLRPDRALPRKRRRLSALVACDPALVGALSVERNVMAGRLGHQGLIASLTGRRTARDRRATEQAMEEVGVAAQRAVRASDLPPETARLVALARCLAQEPRLLLADALPDTAADPLAEERFLRLLTGIARTRRITLVFSCHRPDLALRHAGRIVLLRNGRNLMSGPTDRLDAGERALLMRTAGGAAARGLRLVV